MSLTPTFTPAAKDASNVDPADWQATVNAAIALDPAATRAAANLANAKVFYAKDYGVVADGVTDDTVDLQACINAAGLAATNSQRSVVVLPAGTIMVTRTVDPNTHSDPVWKYAVRMRSNVILRGAGMDATTLKMITATALDTPVIDAIAEYRAGCSVTSGSKTVTVTTTAGLYPGMRVTGSRVQFTSVITSVTDATHVEISNNALSTGTTTLEFGPVNVGFEDLTADCDTWNRTSGGGEGECINVKNGTGVVLRNVRAKNSEQDGFDLDGGQDFVIDGCIMDDCWGSGLHMVYDGVKNVTVTNCFFRRNGFGRRANGTWQNENGSGLDYMGVSIMVSNCVFENNAVEVHHLAGIANYSNCSFFHQPASTLYPSMNTMPAIIAGWEGLAAVTSGTLEMTGCYLNSGSLTAVDVVQAWPHFALRNSWVNGLVKVTSGVTAIVQNNTMQSSTFCVHTVLTTQPALISGNRFITYADAVRVEGTGGGFASNNQFLGGPGTTDFKAMANSQNWTVSGNRFSAGGNTSLNIGNGSSSQNMTVINNNIPQLTISGGGSTGNVYQGNKIDALTHSSSALATASWRNNTGAGLSGLTYGTTTLAAGASTIASVAVSANSKLTLTLKTVGGTIAAQPYVATITPGTGLTLAGGGGSNTSVYNWSITD